MSVYGKGINDMSRGWSVENEWNKRVYRTWKHMLERCYSEKYNKSHPTYKSCSVCERWLLLSNFVEDFKLIDGYDKEKFLNSELELDKDIKTNGTNKIYSLDNCMFISKIENVKQANKTRDNSYLHNRTGKNNPQSKRVVQYDKQGNLIKIWDYIRQVEKELGIHRSDICKCCKGKLKSAGGFIWKYYTTEED